MKVIIPTYKRADTIGKCGGTLYALREVKDLITLVVRPEEVDAYKVHGVNLDVLPAAVKDLGATRQYIWDKYSKSEDYFVIMDDDVQYFNKSLRVQDLEPGSVALKKPNQFWYCPNVNTREDLLQMFKDLENELKQGFGMTSPRPNWTFPDGNDEHYPRRTSTFVTGFWVMNGKLLRDLNLRFDRWVSTGDIDFLFQMLSKGVDSSYLCSYKYNIDVMCQHSEVHQNEIREHEEFAAAWPGYVKKRRVCKSYGFSEQGRQSLTYLRKKLLKDSQQRDDQN